MRDINSDRKFSNILPALGWGALWLAAAGALALATFGRDFAAAPVWPGLPFLHGVLAGQDTLTHDYPAYWWGWGQWRATGHLPLWNPSWFAGMPLVASQTFLPFYPFNWLGAVLPFPLAFNIQYPLHLVLAAAGMAWALRRRGAGWTAAGLGALAWGLGGHLATLAGPGHIQKLQALAWLPVVTTAARGVVRGRGGTGTLGVALALQVMAGHLQIVWLTLVVTALESAAWLFTDKTRLRRLGAGSLWKNAIAAGILALGLSAVYLLPTIEFAELSNRQGALDWENATRGSLPPEEAVEFILPRLRGDNMPAGRGFYAGRYGESSTSVPERVVSDYAGAGVILLALLALALPGRRRWAAGWWALAAGALVLSLGRYCPALYKTALAALPGLAHFRSPSVMMAALAYSLAQAAALGAGQLAQAWEKARQQAQAAPESAPATPSQAPPSARPLEHYSPSMHNPNRPARAPVPQENRSLDCGTAAPGGPASECAYGKTALAAALGALIAVALLYGVLGSLQARWAPLIQTGQLAPGPAQVTVAAARHAAAALGGALAVLTAGCLLVHRRRPAPRWAGPALAAALGLVIAADLISNDRVFWNAAWARPYEQFLTRHWALGPLAPLTRNPQTGPVRWLEPGNELSNRTLTLTDFKAGRVISSVHGYHPVASGRYFDLLDRLGYLSPTFLRLFAVNALLWPADSGQEPPAGWTSAGPPTQGRQLLTSQDNPYVHAVAHLWFAGDWATALDRITAPGFNPLESTTLVLTDGLPEKYRGKQSVIEPIGLHVHSIQILAPGHITLDLSTRRAGPIVVREPYYPGWRVTINGQDAGAPLPADGFFLMIHLPAGHATVELTYNPLSQRLGFYLTLATLLAALSIGVRRKLKKGASPAP